jgi:hypothetical protein
MKDFYDVWLLSRLFQFDGRTLCEAVSKTFERRSTPLPRGLPMAFTDEFRKEARKQTEWRAFVRQSKPKDVPASIDAVISDVAVFSAPVMAAARENEEFLLVWNQRGSWCDLVR